MELQSSLFPLYFLLTAACVCRATIPVHILCKEVLGGVAIYTLTARCHQNICSYFKERSFRLVTKVGLNGTSVGQTRPEFCAILYFCLRHDVFPCISHSFHVTAQSCWI